MRTADESQACSGPLLTDIASLVVRLRQIQTADESLRDFLWSRVETCDLPRLMAYKEISSVVWQVEEF